MKAHREKDQFNPVILTLESQAEVDGIYALLNHVGISRAAGFLGSDDHEALANFTSKDGPHSIHAKLQRLLSKES